VTGLLHFARAAVDLHVAEAEGARLLFAVVAAPNVSFQRSQIANLLYKLEADSGRVVVTDVEIDKADKRLKPHEIPEDRWMFEATLTSRQATDK
jgi:hypothetical protein